ncbi:MAG: hypothetical protein RXS23_07980 [Metallosphaera yellowstonensis]
MVDINTLINYLAYFAWIVDSGGIIVSAILIGMGREEGKKILFGAVAGAFVLAFFWTILTTTIQYQTVNLPYWSYIVEFAYAGAAIATIFAAIEFIRGELREGLGYLLAAILVVFMVNYGPQILGVQSLNLQPANLNAEIGGVGVAGFNFGGVPLSWLIEMPNPSTFSAFQSVFQLSQEVALGILGIAFVFALIIRTYDTEDVFTALKQTSKDTITAAILIYGIVDLYNIFAQVINYAATNIVAPYQGALESIDNIVTGIIIGGFAGGYFVPALADISSDLLFSLFLAAMLALIRFLAIASALAVAPILISLWIVPPLRGVVKFIGDVIIGLGISGLISSVILALLSSFINQYPEILIASPVLFGFLPMMLGFGATGLLPAGAGNLIPFRRGRKSSTQSTSSQGSEVAVGVAGGVARGIAGASQKTVGETKLRRNTLLRHYGTAQSTGSVSPPPAPTGIIGRVRNRHAESVIISAENPLGINVPKGYEVKAKEYTDYGKFQLKPSDHNLRITGNDMSNVTALSAMSSEKYRGATMFPETATNLRVKSVEVRETIPHASVHGVAGNLKAGAIMTTEKFGQKMDDWLNEQGVNVRPFEAVENTIREVKLERASRKKRQTF